MSKKVRLFSALAGIFLLSVVFALAQGTMMQGNQSGTTNGNQNSAMQDRNNNWYQQMMQQREQMQSRIQATDEKLADDLQKLQAAKTDDQKVQIMQTIFTNLIEERNYLHDQVFPMMMSGSGMMYGGGMMNGGMMNSGMTQNGHTMHSGHMGMHGENDHSGMMNRNDDNAWHRQMMQQREAIQTRVQKTDQQLSEDLEKLQAATTDAQKIQMMQTMLENLINERNYVHDQALSMMMMHRQTQSARP